MSSAGMCEMVGRGGCGTTGNVTTIAGDDISQAPTKMPGSWKLIKYQFHFFPKREEARNIKARRTHKISELKEYPW